LYPTKLSHEIRRERYGIRPATQETAVTVNVFDLASQPVQLMKNDAAPGTIAA